MKTLLCTITLLVLTGCCAPNAVITTKCVPVGVPLIYSPMPPVIERPVLPHQVITPDDEKSDGKVVESYAASLQALIGYAEQLEQVIAEYKRINQAYAVLRDKLIKDWKDQTGVDISVGDPTLPSTKP